MVVNEDRDGAHSDSKVDTGSEKGLGDSPILWHGQVTQQADAEWDARAHHERKSDPCEHQLDKRLREGLTERKEGP